jgi:hypothetical protein
MISFHHDCFYSSTVITARRTDFVYSYFLPIQNQSAITQVHGSIELARLYGDAIIKF